MPAVKKSTAKKKAVSKKAPAAKRKATPASTRKAATASRTALTKQLREDLKASREALRRANAAAKEEIKLAREAAKAEVALVKEQLNAALKREQQLMKIAEQKAKMMLSAGERWEKEQIKKLQKMMSGKPTRKKKAASLCIKKRPARAVFHFRASALDMTLTPRLIRYYQIPFHNSARRSPSASTAAPLPPWHWSSWFRQGGETFPASTAQRDRSRPAR
jgi:hypothetical protein